MSATQIERLVRVLSQPQVSFVLIGGLAAIAHGSAYLTYDVDVCYQRTPENLRRLCDALEPVHPYLRGAPPGLPFRLDPRTIESGLNFTLITDLGDLDLLGEVTGLGTFDRVAEASETMELFGFPVRVLSLEGLIRSKKAAGRQKDLNALPELEALLELKRRGGA
jgi:predicted nucleotidyltransferase